MISCFKMLPKPKKEYENLWTSIKYPALHNIIEIKIVGEIEANKFLKEGWLLLKVLENGHIVVGRSKDKE